MPKRRAKATSDVRVVQFHNRYAGGVGGEDAVVDAERHVLEEHGHSVIQYYRDNAELADLTFAGKVGALGLSAWSGQVYDNVRELLERTEPHVAHVHNQHFRLTASVFAACRDLGVPVVQTIHNYRYLCSAGTLFRDGSVCHQCLDGSVWNGIRHGCYRGSRLLTAVVTRNVQVAKRHGLWNGLVSRFIVLSEFAKQLFIQGGCDPERISVKPNFVRDSGVGKHDGPYALYVGRLSVEKGIPTLLAAMKRLGRSVHLKVAGEGPLAAEVRQAGPMVDWLGPVDRSRVLQLMKEARFLVFPSEWYEGCPMTLLEAFATGLPVVGTRLGVMKEMIIPECNGLTVPPGDVPALADAIVWAWMNPLKVIEFGKSARKMYERMYTPERGYERLRAVYDAVLSP